MPKNSIKSTFLDFLYLAEKRPPMYFGSFAARDAANVLAGWKMHRSYYEDDDVFAEYFFTDFHAFVQAKYNDSRTVGWQAIVEENSKIEKEEFALFMCLLRDFVSEFKASS